jgi:hypothetical protein
MLAAACMVRWGATAAAAGDADAQQPAPREQKGSEKEEKATKGGAGSPPSSSSCVVEKKTEMRQHSTPLDSTSSSSQMHTSCSPTKSTSSKQAPRKLVCSHSLTERIADFDGRSSFDENHH